MCLDVTPLATIPIRVDRDDLFLLVSDRLNCRVLPSTTLQTSCGLEEKPWSLSKSCNLSPKLSPSQHTHTRIYIYYLLVLCPFSRIQWPFSYVDTNVFITALGCRRIAFSPFARRKKLGPLLHCGNFRYSCAAVESKVLSCYAYVRETFGKLCRSLAAITHARS